MLIITNILFLLYGALIFLLPVLPRRRNGDSQTRYSGAVTEEKPGFRERTHKRVEREMMPSHSHVGHSILWH